MRVPILPRVVLVSGAPGHKLDNHLAAWRAVRRRRFLRWWSPKGCRSSRRCRHQIRPRTSPARLEHRVEAVRRMGFLRT